MASIGSWKRETTFTPIGLLGAVAGNAPSAASAARMRQQPAPTKHLTSPE